MLLLVVNFHYVQEEGLHPYPGIFPTPPGRLRAQLEHLGKHFVFVSQRDLLEALNKEKRLPERSCLITFDDGLREQYELALGVVDELRVPAVFFVPGLPYARGRALLVHKVQWMRAYMAPAEVFEQFDRELMREGHQPLSARGASGREKVVKARYDGGREAELKHAIKHGLPFQTSERIIDNMFRTAIGDETRFVERLYMEPGMVRELHRRFMLGLHSFSHRPLASLADEEIAADLRCNREILSDICGGDLLPSVAYPYGGPEEVSRRVANISARSGLRVGFTMERAFNRSLEDPLLMARIDTNESLGGRLQGFRFDDDGGLRVHEGLVTANRQVYFREAETRRPSCDGRSAST